MSNRVERLLQRVVLLLARHPRFALGAAGVVAALSALSAARIHPATSMETMLAEHEPASQAMARLIRDYRLVDYLIVVATIPPEAAKGSPATLEGFAGRLAGALGTDPDAIECVTGVEWRHPPDFRRFIEEAVVPNAVYYLDEPGRSRLRSRLSPEGIRTQWRRNAELLASPGPAASALSEVLLRDPLRLHEIIVPAINLPQMTSMAATRDGLLLSRDQRSLMVRIAGRRPVADLAFARRLVETVTRAATEANLDGLDLSITGAYAIAATAERSIRSDMIVSTVCSVVALHLLFTLVYRTWLGGLYALAPVALGTLAGFGVFAFYSAELTPIVAVIGALLAGIGIDYAIHLLSHYGAERRAGHEHRASLHMTLQALAPGLTAAWFTSLLGFAAISLSEVSALRDFAILGGLGLTGIFFATLLILPALLTPGLWGRMSRIIPAPFSATRSRESVASRTSRHGSPRFQALVARPLCRPRPFIAFSLITLSIAVFIVGLSDQHGLSFDTELRTLHPQPNAALDAQNALADQFGRSFDPLFVLHAASEPGELIPNAHRLRRQVLASDAQEFELLNLASLLPDPANTPGARAWLAGMDLDETLSSFDAALEESPFEPRTFTDYRAFLERLLSAQNPPDLGTLDGYGDLASMFLPCANGRAFSQPLTAATESLSLVFPRASVTDRPTRDRMIEALRNRLAELPGATLTGMAVLGHDLERAIQHDLPRYLLASLLAGCLFLIMYFRNLPSTLLSLIPMVFGLVVTLALMQLLDLRLNMVNLIAFPLAVGIGLDHGILLVSLARPNSANQSVLATGLGAACLTTATTILALGTLAFTSTPAIQSLGILLSICMASCLAGAVVLLAPLLVWMECRRVPQTINPDRAREPAP